MAVAGLSDSQGAAEIRDCVALGVIDRIGCGVCAVKPSHLGVRH
jgi:hypothetical protein